MIRAGGALRRVWASHCIIVVATLVVAIFPALAPTSPRWRHLPRSGTNPVIYKLDVDVNDNNDVEYCHGEESRDCVECFGEPSSLLE